MTFAPCLQAADREKMSSMAKRKWKKLLATVSAAAMLLTIPGTENLAPFYKEVQAEDLTDGGESSEDGIFCSDGGEYTEESGSISEEPLDMIPAEEPEIMSESEEPIEKDAAAEDTVLEDTAPKDDVPEEEIFVDSVETEIPEEMIPAGSEDPGVRVTLSVETPENGKEEKTALSGETNVVYIRAEDLNKEIEMPSLVSVYLKDADSGEPVTDIGVAPGNSLEEMEQNAELQKEEAVFSWVLPEAVTFPDKREDLTVERVRESVQDEEGNTVVTEEALRFFLPAGATAEFCAGFSYETEEEDFYKEVKAEAGAVREQPASETDIFNAGDLLFDDAPEEKQEPDAGTDVLAEAASVLLAWSGKAAATPCHIYFAAPENWNTGISTIKINAKQQSDNNTWTTKEMTNTGQTYQTQNGKNLKVYEVDLTVEDCPYGGFEVMQFQRYENEEWVAEVLAFNIWTSAKIFHNKLYDPESEQWVVYQPVDPNDHTALQGKTMYFENKGTETITSVTALFYEKDGNGILQSVSEDPMMSVAGKNNVFSVKIPTKACSYVQFKSETKVLGDKYSDFYAQGTGETEIESFRYEEKTMDTYKYVSSAEDSTWGALGAKTVYFDASLSRLSYEGTVDKNKNLPMPYTEADSKIYCYATDKGGQKGKAFSMEKCQPYTNGTNTWSDLWRVELPEGYTRIRFTAWKDPANEQPAQNGDGTAMYDIPPNMVRPCFYADTSDSVIYEGGDRGGYWAEVYTIRNAESGKKTDVVNISRAELFTQELNTLYVNSTFYDYYTDYELNGNNRDSYKGANDASHRNWVNFRQFDQALSAYYKSGNVSIPIYTGHFQPSVWETSFCDIAHTLDLWGWINYKSFISTNNSGFDINGAGGKYDDAAQGLVSDRLSGNMLMAKGGTVPEPHFNEAFLKGNNSKNAVLGEVYHNVRFPFTKKDVDNDGVDYWYFDSAETTLAMHQDPSSGQYYLKNCGNQGWSQNVNSSGIIGGKDPVSTNYGFFPFNENTEPCSGKNYNYGFGTRLDIMFSLTEDGTVLNKDGNKVPIKFEFSGDDDVWVFIDGKLALDVGGAHGRTTGTLDFQNMQATVSGVKASAGSNTFGQNVQSTFQLQGAKTDQHTLTMFYMERGMWESNMKLMFNFPDENQLQVQKKVDKSEVNPLFTDLFENTSLFTFHIKNQATHYGPKEAADSGAVSREEFQTDTCTPSEGNVCEKVTSGEFSGSVHWKAKYDDTAGQWKDLRKGTIKANTPIDISKMRFLDFSFYYDYPDTPSLNNMYLQLVDTEDHIKNSSDYLAGKTYGIVKPTGQNWVTVRLDLGKMEEGQGFNHQVQSIRFGYNYSRDFYLKDFVFRPVKEAPVKAGFTTKQYEIPGYGSAVSGKLEIPAGAVYTSSKPERAAYAIDEDGKFVLEDNETITFSDQFRRGSYLSVTEESQGDLYDTTWTMYEHETPVTSMSKGSLLDNSPDITGLNNVSGTKPDDGRTEHTATGNNSDGTSYQEGNKYNGNRPKEPCFVFRSYEKPDNLTVATRLKLVFHNKINTGSLVIKKDKAYETDQLDGEYQFRITFQNVGGAGLETFPVKQEIKLEAGKTYTITGIPVGTDYTVEEIVPSDGSSLDDIISTDSSAIIDKTKNTVRGTVTKNPEATTITFKNTRKPLTDVSVEKVWKNQNGQNMTEGLPTEIHVQLQRRRGTDPWKAVETYADVVLTPEMGADPQGQPVVRWKKTITGLDQKVDYTQPESPDWEYRFVELDVSSNPPVVKENGNMITLNGKDYTISYSNSAQENKTEIVNTYTPPKTSIKIRKADGADPEHKLIGGVEFKLEKLKKDGSGNWIVDPSFLSRIAVTGSDSQDSTTYGYAVFEDLADGYYRLTETKAAEGYSLLKEPIEITIDRHGQCLVGKDPVTVENNILNLTVLNRSRFQIPATGSWSRYIMILAGLVIAGTVTIFHLVQKRRKGE